MRHFWHRWLREWLPELSARRKWFQPVRDIKVWDVVLVVSLASLEDTGDIPRERWTGARGENPNEPGYHDESCDEIVSSGAGELDTLFTHEN